MILDDLLTQLAELPTAMYRNVLFAALIGPLFLRLFGLKSFSKIVRPIALLTIVAGMYAKQRKLGDETS
jgi:hypothetical protein